MASWSDAGRPTYATPSLSLSLSDELDESAVLKSASLSSASASFPPPSVAVESFARASVPPAPASRSSPPPLTPPRSLVKMTAARRSTRTRSSFPVNGSTTTRDVPGRDNIHSKSAFALATAVAVACVAVASCALTPHTSYLRFRTKFRKSLSLPEPPFRLDDERSEYDRVSDVDVRESTLAVTLAVSLPRSLPRSSSWIVGRFGDKAEPFPRPRLLCIETSTGSNVP
mmetsp:Transcript_7848/g.28690  ORF Transcript_7848/g.28690 Transcript_7848/m.28690 type:complete len:228 (-) Transcript_7848:361-1044(-)